MTGQLQSSSARPTWLLTGGAGYIGAHVAHALRGAALDVVVLDDLSTGIPARVPDGVPCVTASVLDTEAVRGALRDHTVTGVIHLAAKKSVGESVADPLLYYRENVGGFQSLLQACTLEDVDRVVLSSSAAVYGMPDVDLVTEDVIPRPINPYGTTKLVCELMLTEVAQAHGLRTMSLRYFNVAGAASPRLADTAVANLVPMVFRALGEGQRPQVFGSDYPTADGSCVRDYIHVADLAEAHVAAARRLDGGPVRATYNVGRSAGYSVLEVLDVVAEVTGRDTTPDLVARRAGDPARLVADSRLITDELGWQATHDLHDMVASAWQAWAGSAAPTA